MRTPTALTNLFVTSAAVVLLFLGAGCSAGDPPNPENARPTISQPRDDEETEGEEDEPEVSDADDAVLDGIEERYEEAGIKDIRATAGRVVTIRLEDELTIANATAACAAVRAAGFTDVRVDIDDALEPCP